MHACDEHVTTICGQRQVGDVETEITDNFNFDVRTRRVTFVAQEGIWALRFGTLGSYDKFVTQYNSHLFENTYGLDNDEANRTKVDSNPPPCASLSTCRSKGTQELRSTGCCNV